MSRWPCARGDVAVKPGNTELVPVRHQTVVEKRNPAGLGDVPRVSCSVGAVARACRRTQLECGEDQPRIVEGHAADITQLDLSGNSGRIVARVDE